MKVLKIGTRYREYGHLYNEISEIIDIKDDKALVKVLPEYGGVLYVNFVKKEKNKWTPKVTSTHISDFYINGVLRY